MSSKSASKFSHVTKLPRPVQEQATDKVWGNLEVGHLKFLKKMTRLFVSNAPGVRANDAARAFVIYLSAVY